MITSLVRIVCYLILTGFMVFCIYILPDGPVSIVLGLICFMIGGLSLITAIVETVLLSMGNID